MDPVTAIGLASAIISFVDLGKRVVVRVREYADALDGVPEVYKSISEQLPPIIESLDKIRRHGGENLKSANEGSLRALVPIINGFRSQIALLNEIFESTTPKESDSAWQRQLKVLKSLRRDSDVERIYSRIRGYRETLTFYQVSHFGGLPQVVIDSTFKPRFEIPDHRRVSVFFGREDILADLEHKLDLPGTRPSIVVLHGMGGQGKTQIALRFCQRAYGVDEKGNRRYQAIFWVDASSRESARKSFLDMYEAIKTPQQALLNEDDQISFVKTTLKDWTVPWLLVFDNFDNPSQFQDAREFMPFGLHGAILVTSRHSDSKGFSSTVEGVIDVPGIAEDDAIELLITRSQQGRTEANFEEAGKIVSELGYHPLAIAQAAEYISQLPPLSGFLARYKAQKSLVLKWTPDVWEYRKRVGIKQEPQSLSVFTSFELSLGLLQTDGNSRELAESFLAVAAFLHREYLFEDLFKVAPDTEEWPKLFRGADGGWNSDNFVMMVTKLTKMVLVQSYSLEKRSFSLHPLVCEWLKWRSKGPDPLQYRESNARSAAMILKGYLESTSKDTMVDYQSLDYLMKQNLLLHIMTCQENIDEFLGKASNPVELEEVGETFTSFLDGMGEYDKAAVLQQEVVSRRIKRLPGTNLVLFSSQTRLAGIYRHQGKFAEAESILMRNLKISEATWKPGDPVGLENTVNLVITLSDKRNFDLAEKHAVNVVELKRKHGSDERSLLRSRSMLAWVIQNQKRYVEAEKMNDEVLERRIELFGEGDLDTLTSYNAQGVLYHMTRRFEKAEEYALKASEGRQKQLGRNHPDTLNCLTNLAMIFASRGQLSDAERLTREILKTREERLGFSHIATLASVENLVSILKGQGVATRTGEIAELEKRLTGKDHDIWQPYGEESGRKNFELDALGKAMSRLKIPKRGPTHHRRSQQAENAKIYQSAQQQQQ
jgi:tetratricopeptide (TPR) repeat protein